MAAVRHIGILKIGNFNFRSHSEAQYASPYQISRRLVKPFQRYGRFSIFQDGGRPPFWIFKSCKFQLSVPFGGRIFVSVPNFAKIDWTVPEIWPIFHDGGRPPSWICFTRVGTTHEEYLVVFMTVQNLVVIGAVISIVCKFQYFAL